MSSGKSKGKKKSSKSTSSSRMPLIMAVVAGAVLIAGLFFGGKWVMGQRSVAKDYEASVAKIREQLNRDEDSAQGLLKLSEVPALLVGNPTVSEEVFEGARCSVYRWDSTQEMGFRLKLEKNGPIDEVVEIRTFGAK